MTASSLRGGLGGAVVVEMYLRTTSRRNADGSTVRYVALAQNHGVKGRTRAQVLLNVLGSRRFTTDVERVLFALVANRTVDPASKLAAAEWVTCDAAVPGLGSMDEDQAYRVMDLSGGGRRAGEVSPTPS